MAYDAKAKAFHNSLNKLHGDLQWAKTEGERGGLGLRSVHFAAGLVLAMYDVSLDTGMRSRARTRTQTPALTLA